MIRRKFPYFLLVILFFIPFIMGPICNGGGGPAPPPTVASVSLSIKMPVPGVPITGTCTARLIWNFTPGTLTGSDGTSTPVTMDHNYSDSPDIDENCYFSDIVTNVRAGTWTIEVTDTGWWTTNCVVTLANGNNTVKFTIGRAGCTTGFSPYPG